LRSGLSVPWYSDQRNAHVSQVSVSTAVTPKLEHAKARTEFWRRFAVTTAALARATRCVVPSSWRRSAARPARRADRDRAPRDRRPAATDRLHRRESLTPSERRVAEMAAEGPTNGEIAQALYVTPKTVEMHLPRRPIASSGSTCAGSSQRRWPDPLALSPVLVIAAR
jgi:Bacterial regulatory proteins, luxR family